MTDQPASLAEALARLQTGLPVIAKKATAQYGNYADLADVSRELLPRLGELGLSFSAKPTWVTREDGTREFVLAYKLRHVSGDMDEGEYPLGSNPTNHQQLGSAITYGRRYCLCAITGAVAESDDDGQSASSPAAARKPARGKPPERPAGGLPRNRDGSTSRSQVTDEELAATGQMTDAQQREHNRLEQTLKPKGPQGVERLTAVPDDDPFYTGPAHNHPAGPDDPTPLYGSCPGCMEGAPRTPLRVPSAAPPKAGVIHQHFKRLGATTDAGAYTDEQRYGAMTTITGRKITSTNDLTAVEGIEVAKFIGACRDGDVLIERLATKAGEPLPDP